MNTPNEIPYRTTIEYKWCGKCWQATLYQVQDPDTVYEKQKPVVFFYIIDAKEQKRPC